MNLDEFVSSYVNSFAHYQEADGQQFENLA